MRTYKSKRALTNDVKRLLETISFDATKLSLLEQDEKRTETKKYLMSMIDFINELHFVCEHAYVLISDKSLPHETVIRIRNLITSMEVNIWLIESLFKNGSGLKVVDELKRHHEKSIRCIKLLKNVKTN